MKFKKWIQKYIFSGKVSKSREDELPEFEKLAVKPTGGKNWCDLPYEMKQECMKWMDLQTKFRMRRTGRMEKEIFDRVKFSIDSLDIAIRDGITLKIKDNGRTWMLQSDIDPVDTIIKCAAFLMKSADDIYDFWFWRNIEADILIEYIRGITAKYEASLLHELEQCESFRFSHFTFWIASNIDVPLCMLKKCCVPLESIEIRGKAYFNVRPFLAVPQFTTAKDISYLDRLESEELLQFYFGIAQKWIENDAPIGNHLKVFGNGTAGLIDRFAGRFADRVVVHNTKGVRIRTDNPEKHIIFGIDREMTCQKIIDASEPNLPEEEDEDVDDDVEINMPVE